MKVLILGHGYVAKAICQEMLARGVPFRSNNIPCSHQTFDSMMSMLRIEKIDLVINAAAYVPLPSVDLCKNAITTTILGNVAFPQIVTNACWENNIPIVQLSTACLFNEEREYSEEDSPTRGWNGYCGVYLGSKLTGECVVRRHPKHYILRIRLPFDQTDHPRNYLTKLTNFPVVFDHVNSLTHLGDFAKSVLDLWELRAPYGTYHCVNPGQVSARQVIFGMLSRGIIKQCPEIEEKSGTTGARLSTKKLTEAGVKIRPIEEAMSEALDNWTPCIKR